MSSENDPRLLRQLEFSDDQVEVEAILTVTGDSPDADERGPAGQVVDRVVDLLQEHPVRVKFMPRLKAVMVRGSARFIREIIEQDEVTSSTATDYEVKLL
jgi:hypothetical protein